MTDTFTLADAPVSTQDRVLALGAGLASLEARVVELERLSLREQLDAIRANLQQVHVPAAARLNWAILAQRLRTAADALEALT
jgi:hypothetical protein